MIGFGQPYEMNTLHKGIAEISIIGKLVLKGICNLEKIILST
jgi:hypothetical protein